MDIRPDQGDENSRRETKVEDKAPTPASLTSDSPRKILVVEDERVTQIIISLVLKNAGYTVFTAKDAAAALKILRVEEPDMMTLDINLSRDSAGEVWDGFRIVEWLQRYRRDKTIPVIIISAGNPEAIKKRAEALSAFGYLAKPVEKLHLLEMVREAIGDPPASPPPASSPAAPQPPPLPPPPSEKS
jgi:CheY-like chemotaxis protein